MRQPIFVRPLTEEERGQLEEGLGCVVRKSNRPHNLRTIFDECGVEVLREILHQSPRNYDKPTSTWTLELVKVSTETIALKRLGKSWLRAKHWIVSPDPEYERKEVPETA